MNNVELVVKNGAVIRKFFKGRLIGLMTNEDAQALKNTKGVGRKVYSESTMPFEDLRLVKCGVSRIAVTNPVKRHTLITPVISWYSVSGSFFREFGCRNKSGLITTYALRVLTESEAKSNAD